MTDGRTTLLSAPPPELENLSFAHPEPEAVGEWIGRLPMANIVETAGQIRQATFEIARLDADWSTRMSLLEGIRPTVLYLTARLDKAANTAGNQADAITRLAQRLQSNLCSGYKAVVLAAEPMAEADPEALRIASLGIHRALSDLSRTLLRTLQYYVAPTERLWLKLHQLYFLAEQLDIQEALHHDSENRGVPDLSIESVYLRSLLLAMARPYQLRHRELADAFNAIGNWVHLVKLDDASGNGLYGVDLCSDDGPALTAGFQTSDAVRSINAEALLTQLDAVLKDQDTDLQVPPGLDINLVTHLADAWGEMKPRAFNRARACEPIKVCVGLRAAHYYLSGSVEFADTIGAAAAHPRQETNPFMGDGVHFLPNAGEAQDVWDDAFDVGGKIPENPNFGDPNTVPFQRKATDSDGDKYRYYDTTTADMSPGGYRLRWSEPFPASLQTGELIGLREESDPRWCVAVARWIRQGDEGPFMGVELLAPQARPVAVRLIQSKGGKPEYQRAFLLPELKPLGRPATLITPATPFQPGQKVNLAEDGTKNTAQLGDCLLKTGSFNQFTFRVLDGYLEKSGGQPNMGKQINNNQLGFR